MSPLSRSAPVVWVDRDGTIVDDPGYLKDPADLHLLPGAAPAVARWNRAGARVVLITNQSGIGRGYMSRAQVDAVHVALHRELARAGAHLDAVFLCPHAPADGCDCRKPGPALIERARRELGIEAAVPQAMVGDKVADLGLAWATGCRAVLVQTGDGAATWEALSEADRARVDHTAPDLDSITPWLLRELGLADPARS